MQIDSLILGDFETNCYIVRSSEEATDCLIIDPGFGAEELLDFLNENALEPSGILLTHGHCDHLAGVPLLRGRFGDLAVSVGRPDSEMLTGGRANLSALMGFSLVLPPADRLLDAGDTVNFGDIELRVLATPGHTPGGMSFYCEKDAVVFTGDALFAGSIGRVDFPGGDMQTLLSAIRSELFSLPEATCVYSGHGPETEIGTEKRTNPFLIGS